MADSNPPPSRGRAADPDAVLRLVANSPDGMVIVQGRTIRYDNQGLYQSEADDRIGHVFAERAAPEAQPAIWAVLDAVEAGERAEGRVEWGSLVTGRTIEALLRPTTWEGRPAVAGYLRDMTERTRLNAAVEAQAEELAATVQDLTLYRQMFELARDNIILIQDDIVQVSNGALREPGAASIVGRRMSALMYPDDLERMREGTRSILQGDLEVARWEHRYPSQLPPGYRTMEAIARQIEYRGRPALLVTTRDISERKAIELQLEELSRSDSLTGIPNRRAFYEAVDYWRAEASRNGKCHAVCFIDLDHFKSVNDNFGHQAGDDLLIDIAGRLRATVRRTDIVARLGGDEFAILLPDTTAEATAHVAEKLLAEVDAACAAYPGVSASIGVTTFDSDEDPDEIMNRADRAMYRVKMARRATAG